MPKFIVLWIICLSLNLQAQHSFGFRAGSNFANVSTTEEGTITREKIFGANVGLFLELGVGKKTAIQPELSFIQKGYRTKIQLFDEKNYSTKLNYFDLSLLFKYKIGGKRELGYVIAGPYLGRASSGKTKDLSDGDSTKVEFDAAGGFHRADLGLIVGGGIRIPAGYGNLMLDLRYNIGLYAINENYLLNGNLKNRGINISVGYGLPIRR